MAVLQADDVVGRGLFLRTADLGELCILLLNSLILVGNRMSFAIVRLSGGDYRTTKQFSLNEAWVVPIPCPGVIYPPFVLVSKVKSELNTFE